MRSRSHLLTAILFASGLAAGCDTRGSGSADGGRPCTTDLDCDDTHACTIDSCGVEGFCRYEPIDERCDDGLACEVGRGCVASSSCASDAECDDSIPCTVDTCGVGGICANRAVDERCTAPTSVCDTRMGCVEPGGCDADGECDDAVACTTDSCTVDRTCRNTPLDELCTSPDRCHPTAGCFTPMPCDDASDCDDGDLCNGAEICDDEFGCAPAAGPHVCNDSDACTIDSCNATANRCDFLCDTTRTECGCSPDATCDGQFSLPGASGSCLGGFINWNFTNVTFTNDGGVIEVTGWSVGSTGTPPPMADPGPACPSLDASSTLPGDCDETYRITGTFTDADTFTGTFSVTFTGSCFDCTSVSVPVTGTRI